MRTFLTVALSLALLLLLALPTFPQVCGDVNASGSINLLDVTYLLAYLGGAAPALPTPAMADVDGRLGITISDVAYIMDYLFIGGPMPNCSPILNYSLTNSPNDTLFFPNMYGVPDGIDTVKLPVTTSMGSDVYAHYFPFLAAGPLDNGVFRLDGVTTSMPSGGGDAHWFLQFDTSILSALFVPGHPNPPGQAVNFTLNYVRKSPGLGVIAPVLVNRSPLLVPSFERNADLFLPEVIYKQYVLPPETLTVTPMQLSYTAMAGKVAADSFEVSFGSTGIPISFNLTPSDSWIILKALPGTPMTTPASIWVKASAATLGIGSYNGAINITPVNGGTPMSASSVAVAFHVTTPIVYPPGDFNCDGIVDLQDLSRLIAYLTSSEGTTLNECNQ